MSSTTPINPAPINPSEFVSALRPHLLAQNLTAIVNHVRGRWDHHQIASLLDCECPDTRKVATLVYGLVGENCCVNKLAAKLKDPDPVVAQMAEHGLWAIWFRLGTPEANHQVGRGTLAIGRRDYEHAITHFTRAIELDPSFAEAYNQRAIARFLLERYDECRDDCRMAVKLMPCHFGALAGLGHCHAHDGRLVPALKAYEKALAINPRMDDVRQVVAELRGELCPPEDDCVGLG